MSEPPPSLELDPYYVKYCDANGIPVVASKYVSDAALKQAYYLLINYFAPIPEYQVLMVEAGARLSIYDFYQESTRDVPEFYTTPFDEAEGWAGLGGTLDKPITLTSEQDLLCGVWQTTNSVTVHELSHALRDIVLIANRRGYLSESQGVFANAVRENLWQGAYASTNADEYWAEGVKAYFNVYIDSNGYYYISNREDLKEYDPQLFGLIDTIFGGFEWNPTCQ